MSKVWIPTIANFFFPGAGYLILGVKRVLSLMWIPGFVALTVVEFGIQDSEPDLYWLMFAAVFVINLAFAVDAYQLAQAEADRAV